MKKRPEIREIGREEKKQQSTVAAAAAVCECVGEIDTQACQKKKRR